MSLRQPDRRSCGAASLVMARRLVRPRYAGLVTDQTVFAHEVSTLHRRLTSLSDTAGGWQVPWLRAIGTPPWAVARELRLLTGVSYAVRPVRLRRRVWRHLAAAVPDRPVAVFVGDRWLPRHVVLVTGLDDAGATTYEPASGLTPTVSRERWERGDLGLAGWDRPWLVVSPR
ncbi:hypothetical protein SAMN05192575_10898 [Nocardioides alpinus]|uniref:Peptidase_C39 like family protein n=1 Tax=Nocardioides alpinus TaxID=748909 RepID=A0A1I1ACH7_9ACTN|nr:hypothetical protein [Nocardioides alpinus]PKH43473.1 hypothetical protein CXG46_03140 [Nocardioides alpinus]SFB35192.1 hypothetical protein SAMN05192575_10898 [Nocardioides alpinus]